MQLNTDLILAALKNVRYPGTAKDIVESEMVCDDICIEGNKVSFSLLFDKKNNPFSKSIVRASEQAILTYVGADVDIKGNIQVRYKEQPKPEETPILPGVKNILAVFSGKGGVGKSTVSSNLAVSLAKMGYKVGLLDADIYGPSIPKMFGIEGERPEMEEIDGKQYMIPIEKFGLKILSIGFFIDPDDALVWRGVMASNALRQLIVDALWGDLDYFIIDLPPGTSDIHLTLVQTLGVTGGVIVTTPQAVALADARKGINMFTGDKVRVPIVGLVENMSWFTPAELPENKYYIFGKEGGIRLSEEMNIPFLAQIPLIQSICEGGDEGQPIAISADNKMSSFFENLAKALVLNMENRNENLEKTEPVKMTR